MFEFKRSIQWKGISVRGMGGLRSAHVISYTVYRENPARALSRASHCKIWCLMKETDLPGKKNGRYIPKFYVFRGFHLSTCYP